MPCVDHSTSADWSNSPDHSACKKEIDTLTARLCALCKIIEDAHKDDENCCSCHIPDGLYKWWEKHRLEDLKEQQLQVGYKKYLSACKQMKIKPMTIDKFAVKLSKNYV